MSKLGRKAKNKKQVEKEDGKKAILYLVVGLVIIAIIVGLLVV